MEFVSGRESPASSVKRRRTTQVISITMTKVREMYLGEHTPLHFLQFHNQENFWEVFCKKKKKLFQVNNKDF